MTAIKTNGIGQRTTSHLNLTRTMADVWGIKPGSCARFRLMGDDGEYLHKSGVRMTVVKADAWAGSEDQLRNVTTSVPIAASLKPVEVLR